MNDILKKVSEEKLINIKPNVLIDNLKNEVLDKETLTSSTLTTPTTTTKTTTTTATTTTKTPFNTDAPKISTKNLIADAGENIHIYYPSKSCILNGTLSRFSNSLTYGEITWKWTKLENSPAFGVSFYFLKNRIFIFKLYYFNLLRNLSAQMKHQLSTMKILSKVFTDLFLY